MLFGVDFCKRRAFKRKKPSLAVWRAAVALLLAALVTGLLFLAPQWLLVLLILILVGAVIALAVNK